MTTEDVFFGGLPTGAIICGLAQDGALELESAELRSETAAEGQPTEVTGKAEVPMMAVVAEMMIFANSAVARRIHQAFHSSALLRRHPPPRQDAFKEVQLSHPRLHRSWCKLSLQRWQDDLYRTTMRRHNDTSFLGSAAERNRWLKDVRSTVSMR